MTAGVPMTNHPEDEQLAAFIDGQLDDVTRRQVVEHIASCGECREIVMVADEVVQVLGDGRADADNVVRAPFGKRMLVPLVAAAGIAGVLLFARHPLSNLYTGGMTDVQTAYAELEERDVQPRLSGFEHKPLKPRMRGAGGEGFDTLALQAEHAELANEDGKRSWKEYRALAAASLLTGRREEAVTAIERAAELAPGEPAVANDLAAVYIEQARSSATGDPARALAAAERAWQLAQNPETAWNRAVALELANRDADAIRAWQAYLQRDSSSPWAKEAQSNLQRLQELR